MSATSGEGTTLDFEEPTPPGGNNFSALPYEELVLSQYSKWY